MKVECPRCHTRVEKPLQGDPVCPTCGFGGPSSPISPAGGSEGAPAYGSGATAAPGATAPGAPGTANAPGAAAPSAQASFPAAQAAPMAGASASQPTAPGWSIQSGQAQPNQSLAIVALVLGIVGCCVVPLLGGIAAIVVGAVALKRIKEDPQQYGGHGMALTGLVLGIIGVVVGIIFLIFMFAVFLPLYEFCQDNPEDPQCDGFDQGNSTVTDAGHFQPAARSLVPGWPQTWAVPARYA